MWRWSMGLLVGPAVASAAPVELLHQGRLLSASGSPVHGSHVVEVALCDAPTGGACPYSQSQTIDVQDGYYAVRLGTSSPLQHTVLAGAGWVEVRLDGSPLSPRGPLGESPVAARALSVAPDAVTAAEIAGQAVGSSEVEDGSLVAADVNTGSIQARVNGACSLGQTIVAIAADGTVTCGGNPTSCGNGQVPRWNTSTSTWGCGSAVGGVTFERWGRTVCPASSTEVYKGWMLTGYYTHMGGPSSIHCGHEAPEYAPGATTSGNNNGAILYTMEFETSSRGIGAMASWHDREGRCVVCEAQAAMSLMIPMRRTCPSGWTLQYEGYMMGQYHASHQNGSEAICVDINTETNHGQAGDQNGGLLYPLEWDVTASGTPYTNDAEVSCVVCTK
jgi:hypothetical protein